MEFRTESDTMGSVLVPADAYYGPQTQRAIDNFPISGKRFPRVFIHSLALVKLAAAQVNQELGLLDDSKAQAVIQAAAEVIDGVFDDQFPIDIFQTGSGTSTNMNMNEVLASRANEILSGARAGKHPVHPNDHVNACQSSNDVIPTVIHVSAMREIKTGLLPALDRLCSALSKKASEFGDIRKIGRTHLQDAVPITLGQEFSGYARQAELAIQRISAIEPRLSELAIGGTAVGTGLNAHPEFASRVIEILSRETGINFRKAGNPFEAQAAQDAAAETSGMLKTIAVSLVKIANDIRWLGSGPRCGIGEITIPSLQPGSSIMPGKVNPVIPEAVLQVAAQVVGNDATITIGCQSGNFELNTMLPIIAFNLLESIDLLAKTADLFAARCIEGISANRDKSASFIEMSLAMVTNLIPLMGYDAAAALAKEAFDSGKTIFDIARKKTDIPDVELRHLLSMPEQQVIKKT